LLSESYDREQAADGRGRRQMTYSRWLFMLLLSMLVSCSSGPNKGSIGQLKDVKMELTDLKIEGGLDKAMQSYQKFLEQTPESSMTPEALRRLADLKVQKETGIQ
jgi:hypothetical protein